MIDPFVDTAAATGRVAAGSPVSREMSIGAPAAPGWRERWLARRDRWLASPVFQSRAARLPFARSIARRRAGQVFDLLAGFVYSQVLLACVQLRVFDTLLERPLALAELADRLGLDAERAERLLDAAIALRLVERRPGRTYGLGVLGAPLADNAGLAALVEHHRLLYADLADPVALLRRRPASSQLAGYWPYAGASDPCAAGDVDVARYSELMAASQPLVASAVFAAVDLGAHRCLLDVGGGEGGFVAAAAARAPHLGLVLYDLPAVAARAAARLEAQGLGPRVRVVGGSFLAGPLPAGADLATLIRILHDHDDSDALALLRAVARALEPGGTLIVAEPMAETPGAEAMGDAYFGFYLLAMGKGRPRSAERLIALLRQAGFVAVRRVASAMPLQAQVLVATAPS